MKKHINSQRTSSFASLNSRKAIFCLFIATTVLVGGFFVVNNVRATVTSLTLISPNGAEEWRGNQLITWSSTTDGEENNTISILLSTNGGSSYTELISSLDVTDGSYLWDTTQGPSGALADGDTYKIKIFNPTTGLEDSSENNFAVDNTAPETTIDSIDPVDGNNGWYVSVPEITLSCIDILSGCNETFYRWNGDPGDLSGFTLYNGVSITDAPEGQNILNFYSTDKAVDNNGDNNVEDIQQSATIKVDTTPPTIVSYTLDGLPESVFFNPDAPDSVDIAISANEPVEYNRIKILDGTATEVKFFTQTTSFQATTTKSWDGTGETGDGEYTIQVNIEDFAGNVVDDIDLTPHTIIVDKTNPSLDSFTAPVAGTVYKDSVPVIFEVSDTNDITCAFQVNGDVPVDFVCENGFETNTTISDGLNEGRNDVTFIFTDPAGNELTEGPISIVFDTDNTLTVGSAGEDFATIQEAIDAATAGDTIEVAVGTYEEDIVFNGEDNLKLIAKTGDEVTIKGATLVDDSLGYFADAPNVFILADGIEINGFTIETQPTTAGKHAVVITIGGSDTKILNNDFSVAVGNDANAPSVAVVTYCDDTFCSGNPTGVDISGLTIQGNIFNSLTGTGSYEGIYLNPDTGVGLVTIDNNDFSGNLHRAIGNERSKVDITGNTIFTNLAFADSWQGISLVNWYNEDIADVTISGNEIDGMNTGVRLAHSAVTGLLSNIDISGNTIENNQTGVAVNRSAGAVTLSDKNVFSGNTIAVQNNDSAALNAVENYWSTAYKPTIEGLLDENPGDITFEPYYVDASMTILSNVPVSTVSVDDSFTDGSAGGNLFGYDAFNTIQEGIDMVADSGTVNVAAGTYDENVTVDKSLTLRGDPGAQTESINDAGTGPDTPLLDGTGLSGSAIVIDSGVTDVLIEGFEIANYTDISSGGMGAITSWNTGASDITVQDNYIHDIGWNGVLVGSDDGSAQSGWTVKRNIISTADYAGIELTNTSGSEAAYNDIAIGAGIGFDPSDSGVGIEIAIRDHGTGVTAGTGNSVRDNKITGDGVTPERAGINILSRAYQGTSNALLTGVSIENNTVTGATRGIYVVAEARNNGTAAVENLSITGNTLDGNGDGLVIFDFVNSSGTATHSGISVSGNTIINSTNPSSGIHILSDTSASGITVTGNDISGNAGFGINNEGTGTLNAEDNWWGDATGPNHSTNTAGTANAVSDGIDFSPFCLDENCTTLGSVDPIASFVLTFNLSSPLVNTNSDLTVEALDFAGFTVVNDTSSKIQLIADAGASFGSNLPTLTTGGTAETTITNDKAGVVNVTATLVGSTVADSGQVTFVAAVPSGIELDDVVLPSFGSATDQYLDGWKYIFRITVNNEAETDLFVKFEDWVNTSSSTAKVQIQENTKLVLNSGAGVGITESDIESGFSLGNDYIDQSPGAIDISGIDNNTDREGRQVQFDVFFKIPVDTAPGFYTTEFGILTE